MIKLITVVIMVGVLSGCAGKTQYEIKEQGVLDQVQLANIQKHGFCEGQGLQSYLETRTSYIWTCKDGRNFMLPKGE